MAKEQREDEVWSVALDGIGERGIRRTRQTGGARAEVEVGDLMAEVHQRLVEVEVLETESAGGDPVVMTKGYKEDLHICCTTCTTIA